MADKDIAIRVEDVTIGYGSRILMDQLDFQVKQGEVFVILGGSGCGKSTLLKNMIGIYTPIEGRILIGGDNIVGADEPTSRKILNKIGVMYQMGALFGSMTLLENVRLPLEEFTRLPLEAMDEIAALKLRLVGLGGFEQHHPAEISGGMQKRAAIARAMALDPSIIFLDEPSAGLDPITSAGLDRLITGLARTLGITFVVVSHELPSIFTIADRIIMLDREERGIIASGDPRRLKEGSPDPRVRRFFNREAQNNAEQNGQRGGRV